MSAEITPVGHRIAWGRKYAHVARIYDGGVLDGKGAGFIRSASTLYESAICGRIMLGPLRVSDWEGTREGAEKIHAHRLAELHVVYPELEAPRGLVPCATCFSVYNVERAKVS